MGFPLGILLAIGLSDGTCKTYLLAVHTTAHKHNMNRTATGLERIIASPVVEAAQHDKGFSLLQLGIHNALVPIISEVGLIVTPEMRTRDDACCAVGLESVACGDKQPNEHVTSLGVLTRLLVSMVVVLVITVKLLSFAPGLRGHCDGDGEKGV